jgi:general secretion pathway protein E
MSHGIRHDIETRLQALQKTGPDQIGEIVDVVLSEAVRSLASDVHFEPTHRAVEVRYRIDGVLQHVATLSRDIAANIVARLKVLADLLTYRLDIPQEGRLVTAMGQYGVDMRVSTFPTIHGEKAAVRIFETSDRTLDLEQLGLPAELLAEWRALLRERTGALFLTGPSGSGKTTTIYACLRYLVQQSGGGRHIVTIEDPVEQVLEGVSQAQVRSGTEFDFARGLRSLLRQDPEVIMIGEVRDPETARIAIEAALTGHLVFSSLHAGSSCGVVGRLLDMGVEPYLLTSGLKAILNQRLVRRLCAACRPPQAPWQPVGCSQCAGTGYHGRLLLAELLTLSAPLRQAILARADTSQLETAAQARWTLSSQADHAIAEGWTTQQEIERVLGPR